MLQQEAVLGILVNKDESQGSRIPGESFCRRLSLRSSSYGMSVILFSPENAAALPGRLNGWMLRNGCWEHAESDLPDLIYDRFFCRRPEQRLRARTFLQALADHKPHIRLGGELPGKWEVYRGLHRDAALRGLLPQTIPFDATARLDELLPRCKGGLFLKPAAGMQGRGVISIRPAGQAGSYDFNGRTRRNKPFSLRLRELPECTYWLKLLTRRRRYVIQPLLELNDPSGHPFDLRVLVQKDDRGEWRITGSAIRCGKKGSITSNLHGGGTAAVPEDFLSRLFGPERCGRLLQKAEDASLRISGRLEENFGRFAEFGLDFGIDTSGRLWFLEANAKPGRSAFRHLPAGESALLSIERPLQYARFLFTRRCRPTFINSFNRADAYDKGLSQENVQEVHS